jgi:hypothetical protein
VGSFGQAVFKKRFHEPKPGSYILTPTIVGNYIEMIKDYSAQELMPNFELDNEVARRLELVKEHNGKNYLFKVHPIPVAPEVLNWLATNYTFININVNDKLDQFLRYAIEMETDVWGYFPDPVIPAPLAPTPKSIKIEKKFMTSWVQRSKESDEYINTIEDKIVIQHEDIIALENKFEILNLLGIDDWQDYITEEDKWKVPADRPLEEASTYFMNMEDIREWAYELGLTIQKPPAREIIEESPIEIHFPL